MSSGRITQKHAKEIAKKLQRAESEGVELGAQIVSARKHDIVSVMYGDAIIKTFMIRRSSKVSHDLTHEALCLSITETLEYASCRKSNAKLLENYREKGKLP